MSAWQTVLDFWLNEVGPDKWYAQDAVVDRAIAERFGGTVTAARNGELDHWVLHPREALALLIVLDQFPRNVWRNRPEAFDGDAHAVALAKRALNLGHDLRVPEPERQFFYLPLMHSEHQMDQDRCVRLILMRMPETGDETLRHACAHRDVIRRFGRFPFRNDALGRVCTPAEAAWIAEGGYRA